MSAAFYDFANTQQDSCADAMAESGVIAAGPGSCASVRLKRISTDPAGEPAKTLLGASGRRWGGAGGLDGARNVRLEFSEIG